ncbi:MAG: chitobiase/beta-hexosaminidase C-terminal domain-containing protein [Kiritimatiellae bacterium]|nr:chitobiase/beta-hexosaminidase C-terminal domain-containing protein [Kiritimatiellia bacterium]
MKRGLFTSVVLSAFAVSIVSNAHAATNDWFDAGINAYDSWPSDGSNKTVEGQGMWTNTACATFADEALTVNCEGDDKLTFEAASTVDAFAETTVVYSATMTFPSALTDVSGLSDPGSGIKAGLAVASSGGSPVYCGRAKEPDGSTDIWVVLSGATPVANAATDVFVSVKTENDVLKVQYAVGDTVLTYNDSSWLELAASEASLQGAKFAGTGYSLSALSAKTVTEEIVPPEPPAMATLTLGELPANVTLVSVTTNGIGIAADEGVYYVFDHATVTVTFAAADGYVLTGSTTVVVNIDGDTEVSSESVPTAITPAQAITINEIMASNPSVDKGGIASEKGIAEMDWIELYNGSAQDIDITGWYFSDSVKKPMKAQINGYCVIPAKGYKIVWVDKIHVDPADYAADEAYVALGLSSSGDLIQLADSTGTVVAGQSIDFKNKPQIKGYSYGPVSVQVGSELVPGNGPYVYMKTATPGAANVTQGWGDFTPAVAFSEPHGYKTEAFELTLSCADPEAAIYYTLDGTSPTTDSILYTNAIPISKTTVVRAAVPDPTSVLQFDTSATYIFLDDVLAQAQSTTAPESAVGFPDSGTVKSHKMLYGMRQDVVNGSDRDRLLCGFTNSIATISLVIDPENLFNSSTGIYVNPAGRGEEWERQTMLEQINPLDPKDGFSMPAGLRIRGSNSRTASRPKHALRLFFRSSYGVSSLEHDIFPGEPDKEAGEYDKIDLRCSQNFSWANENNNADTFIHEVFSRDSQRDMGQFHTRSRYYNLFINGQYWGLYQTQERGDEHFAESYAGGDSLDWDVIKTTTRVNETTGETEKYVLEADEGTLDAWSNLWDTVVVNEAGLSADAIYQRVLGNNPDGTRNTAYPELLNPTNLMAYALITHYVVDGDGPVTPQSKHLNNMYALYDRTDGPTSVHGFFHLRHDAEMSFGKRSNVGVTADPTGWGSGDPTTVDSFNKYDAFWNTLEGFSPVKLHWELEKSAAYRRACADQFDKFFLRPGGAMTTEKNIERFAKRMAEIDDAIVCEAARWGKGPDGTGSGFSRSTWLNACKTCTNGFLAARMPYMLSQYRARGWYPSLDTPRVVNGNGDIYEEGGEVPYLAKVYLSADAEGTTYYTLDGSDPMDAGANVYDGNGFAIPDEGATIRARTLKSGEWSALEEVTLESDVPNDQRYGIRIAEILNAAVNDPADEFIILTNTLDRAVSLEGLSIWSEKAGNALVKLAEIGAGVELAVGGTIKLTQPANWIGETKLKNGEIYVELRDFNGKRIQNARVDSGTWFPTGEFNDKGKEIHACDKTGRWFVALEFLGDTDGGEVTLESQWATNSVAPAIPLPEDATTQADVLDLMEYDDRIEPWLVELGATEAGYTAITNFTGSTNALVTCYEFNILPDSNPEIELTIPSITFDENGKPVIEGELLNHGTEVETTIRRELRLYYADTLEALDMTSDDPNKYIVIDPPTFPVEQTDNGSGAPIPPARFYRLKIE